MKKLLPVLAVLIGLAAPAHAQGTLSIAMNIQQDANGRPLAGALLYLYVVGTLATPEIAFQDVGLTQALPWPIAADQVGRLPNFYIPSGSVHARLTDAVGNVQFDYPNVLVIGGAGGGGGGGPTVDPSSIATTGDIKFRLTKEDLSGWVKLNGQTIGNASSGAVHADPSMQNLFTYLWTFCSEAHCPLSPGVRGSSAVADFNANKKIQLLDMRSRMVAGRDCMEASCAGRLLATNVTSGGTDSVDTAAASGGQANKTIALAFLPALSLPVSVSVSTSGGNHSHNATVSGGVNGGSSSVNATYGTGGNNANFPSPPATVTVSIGNSGTLNMSGSGSGTASLNGGGTPLPVENPFLLGSYYIKL